MASQNRCEIFDPEEIGVFPCIYRAVRRATQEQGRDACRTASFEYLTIPV